MPNALSELSEFDTELLRRNKFCMGVKRGREYRCGGDAGESAISKAAELLIEAINQILRWRVWEAWWVEEWMDEWLEKRDRLEVQLRGKYGDEVVNAITGLVDKFINYNEKFLNYWHEVGNEAKELIEDLMSGRAEVIIWESEKGVSVHGEYVTLNVHKTNTDSIVIQLVLNDLGGETIVMPDIFVKTMSEEEYKKFVNEVLMALKGGLEEADGFVEDGYAAMGTTQIWQAITWSLLYPGELYVLVKAVNANEGGVTITWHLVPSHKSLKGKILGNVDKLSEEGLLSFMITAVLGDGDAYIAKVVINGRVYNEAVVKITMSGEEFERWRPLFERLKGMGFSWRPEPVSGGVIDARFHGSNAINLARAMINVLPPVLRDVLDALSFKKWERIKRIAEMEVKFRRGEMSVDIAGYGFTVHVYERTVVLEHKAKDGAEVEKVIAALRAVYGDGFYAYVNKGGKYLLVIIPMYVFEKYEDIRAQVVKVLCRKYERTKDEKKRQIITKHLKRLTAPTKETAMANHQTEEFT